MMDSQWSWTTITIKVNDDLKGLIFLVIEVNVVVLFTIVSMPRLLLLNSIDIVPSLKKSSSL